MRSDWSIPLHLDSNWRMAVTLVAMATWCVPTPSEAQIFVCASATEPQLLALKNIIVGVVAGSDTGTRPHYHFAPTRASKVGVMASSKICRPAAGISRGGIPRRAALPAHTE